MLAVGEVQAMAVSPLQEFPRLNQVKGPEPLAAIAPVGNASQGAQNQNQAANANSGANANQSGGQQYSLQNQAMLNMQAQAVGDPGANAGKSQASQTAKAAGQGVAAYSRRPAQSSRSSLSLSV